MKSRLVKSPKRCSGAGKRGRKKGKLPVCPGGRLALSEGKGEGGWAFSSSLFLFYIPAWTTFAHSQHRAGTIHGRIWKRKVTRVLKMVSKASSDRGYCIEQWLLAVGDLNNLPLCYQGRKQQRGPFASIPPGTLIQVVALP